MTNLEDLPTEVILRIVELLCITNERMPTIGYDAALKTRYQYLDHSELEEIDEIVNGDVKYRSPIKSLRQTCRYFNQICSPFLFHTLDLVSYDWEGKTSVFDPDQRHSILSQHWERIRTIRVNIDGVDPVFRCQEVAQLLGECSKVQSLALYYFSGSTDTTLLAESVVKLLENGHLKNLGIYSNMVIESPPLRNWEFFPVNAPMTILEAILNSVKASNALHVLDITSESMPKQVYDGVRSGLKNLRSLTIHRSFRYVLGDMCGGDSRLKWSPKANLTRLQLINCQNAYAPHIPDFIEHFDSIRELWIMACGHSNDVPSPDRPRGWSKAPNATWSIRVPLDEILIEHMDDWEILALGSIPTRKLILVSMGNRPVLQTLCRDPEVFPETKVLVTVPGEPNELPISPKGETDSNTITLETFCSERGITWKKEAERLRSCNATCCEGQW